MSCATCKHWDANGPKLEYQVDDDTCTWLPASQRRCLRMVSRGISSAKPDESVPFMTDSEQRGASFWTPASFGCSLHEPRPTERNPALDYREFGITEL